MCQIDSRIPTHSPPPCRLAPSQVIPFKATVSKMVDHFESRVNELTDGELSLAGRVLQVSKMDEWAGGGWVMVVVVVGRVGGRVMALGWCRWQ